jgi:hypothetical protein
LRGLHSVAAGDDGPSVADFAEFHLAQQQLSAPRPPKKFMIFEDLVGDESVAFRDVTPFFDPAGITFSSSRGKVVLVRPRGWGKSVLGQAWVEFLRGNATLFENTWARDKMAMCRRLIGVHLDFSDGGPPGMCVMALVDAINDGLALAETEFRFGSDEKGRRVQISAEFLRLNSDATAWTATACTGVARGVLSELESIARDVDRDVALFVDEYDKPLLSALAEDESGALAEQVLKFMTYFYALLKPRHFIPFVFVTGSSRLAMEALRSGGDDIVDLSHEKAAATALGYTWDDVEKLYGEHLPLLEKLHGLTREELKARMALWYGSHRWSTNTAAELFNPLSVNMFVETGMFHAHSMRAGQLPPLFNKSLFKKDVMPLLLSEKAAVKANLSELVGCDAKLPLSAAAQLSVLVSSGILTFAPTSRPASLEISLSIANEEGRLLVAEILSSAAQPSVTSRVRAAVATYCVDGDAMRLLVELDASGDLAKCALDFAGGKAVSEAHIRQAIAALVLGARAKLDDFVVRREVGVPNEMPHTPWLDLAFARPGGMGCAVVLQCYKGSCAMYKSKSFLKGVDLLLLDGVNLLQSGYKNFEMGVPLSSRRYTCMLFGENARLIVYTDWLEYSELAEVKASLQEKAEWSRFLDWSEGWK